MEENKENVVEETTQENVTKVEIKETPQDDNIIKVNLDKPINQEKNETKEDNADDSGVVTELKDAESTEKQKEDRKDERTKIQATQQSEMIDQRNSGKPPKNFESAGNDILGGGFNMGAFAPR